jgi:hypothetical protein
MRTGMWRTVPAARNPDIGASVPAMIAVNPDITPIRGWRPVFDHRRRRPNANDNLRK